MTISQIAIGAFEQGLNALAVGIASFIPLLIVALFAFVVLWLVAVMLGRLVETVVRSLKVDSLLEGLGVEEPLARAGWKLDSGAFLGGLVRWFFIVLALLVATNILNLDAVSDFLSSAVLGFIPNVIVSAIIIIISAVLADVVQKLVHGAAQAVNMPASGVIGAVAKWSIWVFAILAALYQLSLNIAEPVIQIVTTLFTAIFGMLALAFGLAFGLGGKEHASQFIDKMKREMKG